MARFDEWFEPSEVLAAIEGHGKGGVGKAFLKSKIKKKYHLEFEDFLRDAVKDGQVKIVGSRLVAAPEGKSFKKQFNSQLHDTYSGFG